MVRENPPDDPHQPPGNPRWVGNLAETNQAQREPIAKGVDRIPTLDPTHWSGSASESFVNRRNDITAEWRSVLDLHTQVTGRVDGYNTFVNELPYLWQSSADDPTELTRLRSLWHGTATAIAKELLKAAADLDRVATAPLSVPEQRHPPVEPQPVAPTAALAEPDWPLNDPDSPYDNEPTAPDTADHSAEPPAETTPAPETTPPGLQSAITALTERFLATERLNELLWTGEPRFRIPVPT